jgi:hypothetical protein
MLEIGSDLGSDILGEREIPRTDNIPLQQTTGD